ncbi:MAG: hypothetical protein DI538_02365 [Azospira oryzae]|jgi:hypothetical protein|nr:MAG: hypothetical protein DI538_02365 [Azospira oryzae]
MFKFLLIFSLIIYSVYKIGSMFFRAGAATQQYRHQREQQKVDKASAKKERSKGIKGGEYVDYEEVK